MGEEGKENIVKWYSTCFFLNQITYIERQLYLIFL